MNMKFDNDDLCGFIPTLCFLKNHKEKKGQTHNQDKSKSKDKKKDFSNERNRKRNWE